MANVKTQPVAGSNEVVERHVQELLDRLAAGYTASLPVERYNAFVDLAARLVATQKALRFARRRISEDRVTMSALSDIFQAKSDSAALFDARETQDAVDAETFAIIDAALIGGPPQPDDQSGERATTKRLS